jgi:hypothetical protein
VVAAKRYGGNVVLVVMNGKQLQILVVVQKSMVICSTCGFEWQAVVAERNKGHCGCPKCKRSNKKCK